MSRLLAKHRKLKSVPGERARYSNLGYLVLGEVISEVTGASYEEYVREEILPPLGMVRTGFSYPEESLGLVVMGNTTSYDHESVCDAIVSVPWE